MRRLSASRASTAVAVVAATVAVLAVMFPGLGFGETTSSHGLSPTDVYTQTTPDPGNTCLAAGPNGQTAMEQFFDLGVESHVVVYFTSEWARLNTFERGHISMGLEGQPEVPSEGWRFSGTISSHTSGTVMWTFDNVAPGHHRVNVFGRVAFIQHDASDRPSADLNACALTVLVSPVAPSPPIS
ncbi:MAG TPA: hypothetical protein VGL16_04935 [Actinomycetota bacterium]|jgi:hypothetical protein